MRKFLFLIAISCFIASAGMSQDLVTVPRAIAAYPDMILYNGKIVTMDDTSTGLSPGSIVEAIALRDKKIQALGTNTEMLSYAGPQTQKMDLKGRTVIPGLIDSHFHVVFGEYQPRQKVVDFIDSYVHGGVTSMISAGEIHTPGRPKDAAGVKALAVAAQRSFAAFHPTGAKVHAGAVILEPTLAEKDFAE
ncbi:MAG: hypothetical protein IH935_06020, partial [Acidobacteria bacterium]|nr:hypothetical protein [Acidobacteriota bacterium]